MEAINKCIKCGEKAPLYSYVATLNSKTQSGCFCEKCFKEVARKSPRKGA